MATKRLKTKKKTQFTNFSLKIASWFNFIKQYNLHIAICPRKGRQTMAMDRTRKSGTKEHLGSETGSTISLCHLILKNSFVKHNQENFKAKN